jgi:geranylgeranyl diphosphate synthase type II
MPDVIALRPALGGAAQPDPGATAEDAAGPALLAALEARLAAAFGPADDPVAAACREQIAAGGGRVRARLALDAAPGLGLEPARALAVATAVELLHNASLAHDDLADGDRTRRGDPALWVRHGEDVALLAGDVMISVAYGAAAPLGSAAIAPMHGAIAETAAGQAADRRGLARCAGIAAWEATARAKSGPLIALPLVMASRLAGLPDDPATARTARHAALVYQLADDLGDVAADRAAPEGPALNAVLVTARDRGISEAAAADALRARAVRELAAVAEAASRLPAGVSEAMGTLVTRLAGKLEEV